MLQRQNAMDVKNISGMRVVIKQVECAMYLTYQSEQRQQSDEKNHHGNACIRTQGAVLWLQVSLNYLEPFTWCRRMF